MREVQHIKTIQLNIFVDADILSNHDYDLGKIELYHIFKLLIIKGGGACRCGLLWTNC